jgi:hypothetical protein
MRNLAKIWLLAAGLLLAESAVAEGYYAAIDAGQTKAVDACSGAGGLGVVGCKDTTTAWRIAGGYRFSPYWSVEASYGDYGRATLGTCSGTGLCGLFGLGGRSLGDWSSNGIQASVIGTYPFADTGLGVFAKAGVARTTLELKNIGMSATTTNLAGGLGVQFDFNKKFSMRAQYETLGTVGEVSTTGKTKVSLTTGGLIIRF